MPRSANVGVRANPEPITEFVIPMQLDGVGSVAEESAV
jgi:hypothetical protein